MRLLLPLVLIGAILAVGCPSTPTTKPAIKPSPATPGGPGKTDSGMPKEEAKKLPEEKKPEEKKPEEKKPDEKKPDEKKPDEKK